MPKAQQILASGTRNLASEREKLIALPPTVIRSITDSIQAFIVFSLSSWFSCLSLPPSIKYCDVWIDSWSSFLKIMGKSKKMALHPVVRGRNWDCYLERRLFHGLVFQKLLGRIGTDSGLPGIRMSVQMHDRNDEDAVLTDLINHTIWKSVGSGPSCSFGKGGPGKGILQNT